MSTSRAIKCDNCGTIEMMNQLMQDDMDLDGAPIGWIRLFINQAPRYSFNRNNDRGDRAGWFDICSRSCATSVIYNYNTDQ
jgi:hypothetical protein